MTWQYLLRSIIYVSHNVKCTYSFGKGLLANEGKGAMSNLQLFIGLFAQHSA